MSARELVNHSYFMDALSGDFYPPTDPRHRKHTLGRLLLGTIEKGSVENPNSHREIRTYEPSWAPISSFVHVSHWDIRSFMLVAPARILHVEHTLKGKDKKQFG